MRRVGKNCFTEIYFWGCNPSYVETSDGIVMIDTPQQPVDAVRWREHMETKGPIRHLINSEPHADHIAGNAYFPNVEVIGQIQIRANFEQYLWAHVTAEERYERLKQVDLDSVWLYGHPDYPYSNPPTRTFEDELKFALGKHTIHCIHMPGHTSAQTSVHVPEEGVVFTGDNVFYKCRTWIQEGDPWNWLESLKRIDALDADVIVPGHGEPCGKDYLKQQAQIIENWVGLVADLVKKGVTAEEAVEMPLDIKKVDPYPMAQRLEPLEQRAMSGTIRNLHKLLSRSKQAA
jgi:glyoxylase-like metal-dependent hydrolase (beta-lactamase superfamily II)